jgi:hypothetical protein
LQEKVLKEAFRNKKWKSIDAFFFKNTVKWSPKYWINGQKFTVHIYVCKINKW